MRIRFKGSRAIACGLGLMLAAGLAGCDCGGGGGDTDAGTDAGPPGDPYGYVTTALRLPMTGEMLGVDVDGNGQIDNALGNLLQTLGALVGMGFDAQGSITMALQDGSLVMLWNVTDVNAFDTDSNVGVEFYIGDNAMQDLTAYTSGGTFTISTASPMITPLAGQIAGSALVTTPASLPLVIPLPMMGGLPATINLTLVDGQIQCPTVSADVMMTCILGGAITQEEIDTEIVPAILAFINGGILDAATLDPGTMMSVPCTADCPVGGCPDPAMDGHSATCDALGIAGSICSAWNGTDMGICVDGGSGLIGFVLAPTTDMNGDGVVEQAELAPILALVLSPDLDLDTSLSTCNGTTCGSGATACTVDMDCIDACDATPEPGCDGVRDALSIGLEFTARAATIDGLN
jgi:hypothetical protein